MVSVPVNKVKEPKMTEYQQIIADKTKSKRGRKPLPAEEKARRVEIQKEKNRLRQEARRRASLVLQHRYADEFDALYKVEFANIELTK
jgi:hypothetical protein